VRTGIECPNWAIGVGLSVLQIFTNFTEVTQPSLEALMISDAGFVVVRPSLLCPRFPWSECYSPESCALPFPDFESLVRFLLIPPILRMRMRC
jgi:hypothetical protein